MLQKWKCILSNWINCYFSDNNDVQTVNLDSLLNLITHLRSNLNLDESKSSILGAHTIEEFILEKYPEFKFENGTVEATNEEDVYLVASLLLFFVCVNSKEVDIKYAMCSRLCTEDQETIFKFSKCLMGCKPIFRRDVQSAITEACGLALAAMTSTINHVTVADTPPALRSLHGEVRRLQAALDAERFDRNYLQEELARTNIRVEKLLKDKEQYKLDIVNLKAKVSLCCGQEDESRSNEAKADLSAKLSRELKEMEELLVQTQDKLDDVKYDRDTYKTKAEELKQDRDKWLQISQQETAQVSQLTEELEAERHSIQSLKELVVELRQHNRLNRFDSSLLECDDPDASIQSLHHNLSVCSEVCANVVEVQLGEERAKIVVLEQKIQSLQDQIHDLQEGAENEKRTFETINTDKETEIFNLKHRINEEIEDKNNLIGHFNNEVTKLNNEINELEQRLKGNSENSRAIIERKMQEIQVLQEEKLSLLQSLSDETTKLENIIKGLKVEIDTEKQAKLNMRDSYENHIMKLNEKVLNRNNELVELQNNVFEKSEAMETLHLELRKSKEIYDELSNKYHKHMLQINEEKNAIENILQQKFEEVSELNAILEQKVAVISSLNDKIEDLNKSVSNLNDDCKVLEETKTKLLNDIHNRDTKLGKIYKDTENLKNMFCEERDKLKLDLNEKNAMINTLQIQLQNEIQCKIQFQHELTYLQKVKTELADNLNSTNGELSKLKAQLKEKDKIVDAMDMCLNEEKNRNEKLSLEIDNLKEKLQKVCNETNDFKAQNHVLENKKKYLQDQLEKNVSLIEVINNKLQTEVAEKEVLNLNLTSLNNDKTCLEKEVLEKSESILKLQTEMDHLSQVIEENKIALKTDKENLKKECQKYIQLEKSFDVQTSKMIARLNENEKTIKELSCNSKKTIHRNDLEIQALNKEIDSMKSMAENDREKVLIVQKEKEALLQILENEKSHKNLIEKEYQQQCIKLDDATKQLNNEIVTKNDQINVFKVELKTMSKIKDDKSAEIEILEKRLSEQKQMDQELIYQKSMEIKELQRKMNDLESYNEELEQERNREEDNKKQVIQSLQKENEQLHFTIEEDNSNHEVILKEKDKIIDALEQQLKDRALQIESIKRDFENITLTWEKFKCEARENLQAKDVQISQLNERIEQLQSNLIVTEKVNDEIKNHIEQLLKEKEDAVQILLNENIVLKDTLAMEKDNYSVAVHEKALLQTQLVEEKIVIDALETEKKKIANEKATVICEGEELLNAKAILTQELSEERSLRKILEEEINALKSEKIDIERELINEIAVKNTLLDDKECLTQLIIEEKSTRHVTEKEKENLVIVKESLESKLLLNETNIEKLTKEINDLIKKQTNLKDENMKEKSDRELLKNEKEKLDQELHTEKLCRNEVLKEKEHLLNENKLLQDNIINNKLIQDTLITDKELLLLDKETLVKSLSEEKSARDEAETEKGVLLEKNNSLEKIYRLELNTKIEELNNIQVELKCLKENFKTETQNNARICSILNIGLNKLIGNLKREDITNEVLQQLVMVGTKQDVSAHDKCDLMVNIADTLITEVSMGKNLEKALLHENSALSEMQEMCKQKKIKMLELQTEVNRLQQIVNEKKIELSKQTEAYNSSLNSKERDIQILQKENQTLSNDLTDVKQQLEVKVHSLKEKLTDNELLTDKLKKSYECQIDNLNLMINKLTNYMKDKTVELDAMRKEREQLQQAVEDNKKVIKSLEDALNTEKQNQSKLINDFESERLVLKNMVTVTESVMEDQKVGLSDVISEHLKTNKILQDENNALKELIEIKKNDFELTLDEKDNVIRAMFKDLSDLKEEKDKIEILKHDMTIEINSLKDEINKKTSEMEAQNKNMANVLQKYKDDIEIIENHYKNLKDKNKTCELELERIREALNDKTDTITNLDSTLKEKMQHITELQDKVKVFTEDVSCLLNEKNVLELEKKELTAKNESIKAQLDSKLSNENEESVKLKNDNVDLVNIVEENKTVITNLEQLIKHELEQNHKLREENNIEKLSFVHKCSILDDNRIKAENQLEEYQKEMTSLKKELETLKAEIDICKQDLRDKDEYISKISEEENELVSTMSNELLKEKEMISKMQRDMDLKTAAIIELKKQLDEANNDGELRALRKENDELIQAIGQRETFAVLSQEKTSPKLCQVEKERLLQQVDNSSSDITQSSMESLKTITDLEKIIHDKNRTITTLQTDITYLKSIMAESETKLLDVTKELEVSKDNCHQLASQLKKIVYQKNEELGELKKQVAKMSVTENRASQIIRVSAKYQAIILKRIAEIKSNTVLKELTNFGNSNTCDNDLRRSLNAGTITMEDLEYFLETTDRHLKRCSEKQIALQKERDRLSEVNRINESEIINLQKFLTELSVSFQTFSSVKDLYSQKLSRIVSVQRTVRRDILSLDGHITDVTMCKLERGYAAVMQDLSECAMNLERWVERCISRTASPEKIKQAFMSDTERVSLASTSFQNAGLEVQLEELENSFQKLLEEVARAPKGEGAKDAQAVTLTEVRAEYEDKLNRMKAKMKQLYQEQILIFKEKQREEIAVLEQELLKTRDKLAESSKAYEEHIRSLTTELWSVGEKFLMMKDEAEWLRRKQRSGSLMSLQHVHSSGLMPPQETSRPSDSHSLRSLPVNNTKREGRGLHMSDEEGEVFDNRCLKELSATPRRSPRAGAGAGAGVGAGVGAGAGGGVRLSELRWRNSLCPPHLKSCYPAETQFVPALQEEDIKYAGTASLGGKQQRKEVGITAYKKPGPPTPSKQAGRLSATDSELRESLRVEGEPQGARRAGASATPSRLRALFRSARSDTAESTPRSRRLSNIFRKK